MTDPSLFELMRDDRRIKSLFALKKEQLGIAPKQTVFIDAVDIATFYWCGIKAVFQARENELQFFKDYLFDRIKRAFELKRIEEIPDKDQDILAVGNDITFEDIEGILKTKAEPENFEFGYMTHRGKKIYFKRRDILPPLAQKLTSLASKEDVTILEEEDLPHFFKEMKADSGFRKMWRLFQYQYPTIRWHFTFGNYICITKPGGIGNDFIYEYENIGPKFLLNYKKLPLSDFADISGLCFQKSKKKIEFAIEETCQKDSFEEEINKERILQVLSEFEAVINGAAPIAPAYWKCQKCRYQKRCSVFRSETTLRKKAEKAKNIEKAQKLEEAAKARKAAKAEKKRLKKLAKEQVENQKEVKQKPQKKQPQKVKVPKAAVKKVTPNNSSKKIRRVSDEELDKLVKSYRAKRFKKK